jgi:uncharacterized protein (TIGR03067 family)
MILLFLAPIAFAAPVPRDRKASDDQSILGGWELTAYERGTNAKLKAAATSTLNVGNKWVLEPDNKMTMYRKATKTTPRPHTYKIDSTKNPKTIEWRMTSAAGDEIETGLVYRGIYEIDGDTLKICYVTSGSKELPKSLKPEVGQFLYTFKRLPKDK